MLKVAITGTIASGKSEVSRWLKSHGYPVFNADAYAHVCLQKNHPAYTEAVRIFSDSILNDTGEIDRHRLAGRVFQNEKERKQLNAIIHPHVKQGLLQAMQENSGKELFFAEIPLLFETGWENLFDQTAVVTCSRETAVQRCMQTRGYSRRQAEERLNSQMGAGEQIARAQKVFYNDGTLEQLDQETEAWVNGLLERIRNGTQS